jgi:hypothetical protein
MNTRKLLLTLVTVGLVAGYAGYTSFRVHQLEIRVAELEQEQRNLPTSGVRYAMDDSFIKYFGQKGVEEGARALKVLEDGTAGGTASPAGPILRDPAVSP